MEGTQSSHQPTSKSLSHNSIFSSSALVQNNGLLGGGTPLLHPCNSVVAEYREDDLPYTDHDVQVDVDQDCPTVTDDGFGNDAQLGSANNETMGDGNSATIIVSSFSVLSSLVVFRVAQEMFM